MPWSKTFETDAELDADLTSLQNSLRERYNDRLPSSIASSSSPTNFSFPSWSTVRPSFSIPLRHTIHKVLSHQKPGVIRSLYIMQDLVEAVRVELRGNPKAVRYTTLEILIEILEAFLAIEMNTASGLHEHFSESYRIFVFNSAKELSTIKIDVNVKTTCYSADLYEISIMPKITEFGFGRYWWFTTSIVDFNALNSSLRSRSLSPYYKRNATGSIDFEKCIEMASKRLPIFSPSFEEKA